MNIVIAGTGAMGATYGSLLKKAGNNVVFLDAWEENIQQINKNGVKFNNLGIEETLTIPTFQPYDYTEIPDLIIIFTKSMRLRIALHNIAHLIGKKTQVLCMLNGLGHIETLQEFVPVENILMGVTTLTAAMQGPGKFAVSSYGKTELQNIAQGYETPALAVIETMKNAGLPAVHADNIRYAIWRKACINGTMNACCTLLECNMLSLGKIDNLSLLLTTIVEEFAAVAKLDGVTLDVAEITAYVTSFTDEQFAGSRHYPSMYQDLIKNHRPTEIDFLNGYVAKKARENGFNAKYCELITLLIHGKENVLNVQG